MSATAKPLLLLDVDGPLNPWELITNKGYRPPRGTAYTYTKHRLRPAGWETGAPLQVLISPDHGRELNRLADLYTLIWATTWVEDANRLLAPLLGIDTLPVIEWPPDAQTWPSNPHHTGSWKTRHITRWLDEFGYAPDGSRLPWVWVDDEVNRHDRDWFRTHYGTARGQAPPVRHRLLRVEPYHGLREIDFDALTDFAATHPNRAPERSTA